MQHLVDSEFEQRRLDEWGDFPSLVVVADDLADVSLHGKTLSNALSKISTAGRSTRMYLWISTQAGGSNRGMADMIIGANMLFRIIYATADPGESYRAAGVTGHDLSLSQHLGDAYIVVDGRPIRGATGFTESADIRGAGGGGRSAPRDSRYPPPLTSGVPERKPGYGPG